MIDVAHLSKRYGDTLAVDDLTFQVRPGRVTGFLGPNGAGKSTTMRMIVDLDAPLCGTVTVNGRQYRELPAPLCEVGTMLEARAIHTGRSAYHHLLAMAQTHGIPTWRVVEVIERVGLESVARKRVGSFSLGMGQRLGIAAALLGDPSTLVLDEPVLAAAATGLALGLGFQERRRTFAIASALGAKGRQLGGFVWSESVFVTAGGLLLGAVIAVGISDMLVKVLTGVFDPPPDALSVPWGYLAVVAGLACGTVAAAGAVTLPALRRPGIEELRDL